MCYKKLLVSGIEDYLFNCLNKYTTSADVSGFPYALLTIDGLNSTIILSPDPISPTFEAFHSGFFFFTSCPSLILRTSSASSADSILLLMQGTQSFLSQY